MRFLRELVAQNVSEDHTKIGGPNMIVEIDECKLGKRKYNRGHRVEGVWVLGGVERSPDRRSFVVPVPDRSAATLLPILSQHIRSGSIVYSDLWRAYSGIPAELGFEHATVNHSRNFRDPHTGVHTNSIEGTWNGLKLSIPPRNRTEEHIDDHLFEFLWRRANTNCLWDALLLVLKEVAYL